MKIKDRAKPKAPPVEPGVYMAVCVGVVDLGEQYSEKFKSYSNKVKFVWALPGETIEIDGKPEERQLSKEFTISSSKKGSLRGFLESWNSRNYSDEEFGEVDLFDQIGKACQLQVVLNDTGEYSNVANLMPLPKGMPATRRSSHGIWMPGTMQHLRSCLHGRRIRSRSLRNIRKTMRRRPSWRSMLLPMLARSDCKKEDYHGIQSICKQFLRQCVLGF